MEQFLSLETYSKEHNLDEDIITLAHKTTGNINNVIILIEGPDDEDIYVNFFNMSKVSLHVCQGCTRVANNIRNKRKTVGKDDVIAILDSDFRKLEKPKKGNSYIFYTDCHDMEMTIFCVSDLYHKIYKEINRLTNRKNIIDVDNLRVCIERELQNLSMLKWFNMYKALKFEEPDPDLHDKTTYKKALDLNAMSALFVPSKTCKHKVYPLNEFSKFAKSRKNVDLNQLTNGHDYLCRWASIIKYESSYQISNAGLRRLVVEKFTTDMAKQTKLYADLSAWAAIHVRGIMS